MELSEEEKKIIESINYYIKKKEELCDLGNDFIINFRDTKPLKTLLHLIENQQKEIEEKSIIIMAGAEKVKQLEKGNRSLMDSRKKWKDRYYKQKHEIKELKEQNNQLSNYLNDSYYVSADKIREKLNQIHNEFSNILLDKTLSLEEQNLNAYRYDAIRNVLEELLND